MYIPELDALIFLATEFLEGDADQPTLESGIRALHEAAGQLSKSRPYRTLGSSQSSPEQL